MELRHVIPNMEKTFETLEYAGEGKSEQRRINCKQTILSRSYNLITKMLNFQCSRKVIQHEDP